MTYHPSRRTQLDCPSTYGTHKCSQLNGHDGIHYCPCTGEDNHQWKTGALAPLSAFNPKLLKAHHVLQLRERGLIK